MEFEVEGSDDVCHRVVASCEFLPPSTWYVVKEEGEYRLLNPRSDRAMLGVRALACLERDDKFPMTIRCGRN